MKSAYLFNLKKKHCKDVIVYIFYKRDLYGIGCFPLCQFKRHNFKQVYANILRPFSLLVWMCILSAWLGLNFILILTVAASFWVYQDDSTKRRSADQAVMFPFASLMKQGTSVETIIDRFLLVTRECPNWQSAILGDIYCTYVMTDDRWDTDTTVWYKRASVNADHFSKGPEWQCMERNKAKILDMSIFIRVNLLNSGQGTRI